MGNLKTLGRELVLTCVLKDGKEGFGTWRWGSGLSARGVVGTKLEKSARAIGGVSRGREELDSVAKCASGRQSPPPSKLDRSKAARVFPRSTCAGYSDALWTLRTSNKLRIFRGIKGSCACSFTSLRLWFSLSLRCGLKPLVSVCACQ